jgi:DNA-binding NtrC family response regulator
LVAFENSNALIEPAAPTATRAHLLLVDDEEIIVLGLRETLTRAGYEVRTATSGVAALELLHQEQFALILTDQKMPELTGLQFLAQAKEIQPNATRVLMTGVLDLATVIDQALAARRIDRNGGQRGAAP